MLRRLAAILAALMLAVGQTVLGKWPTLTPPSGVTRVEPKGRR